MLMYPAFCTSKLVLSTFLYIMEAVKTSPIKKMTFDKSGYFFIALLILAFLGFWQSYFSKFVTGINDTSFYFHFHAVMMVLWVSLLIIQPILVRNKKLHLHKRLGKLSYILMPVMLLSVLLILHSALNAVPPDKISFDMMLFPFRDFWLLIIAFVIAIRYRQNVQIHARAMIITGLVFIEPALFRFFNHMIFKDMGPVAAFAAMFLILSLLTTLVVLERKQKSGRWLFPSFLVIDIIVYSILIFEIPLTFLDPVARWFAALPLT